MIMRVGISILRLALFLRSIPLSVSEDADVVCQTRQQCDDMREELGYEKLYVGMAFPGRWCKPHSSCGVLLAANFDSIQAKGCFRKGERLYFGSGGTPAQKAKPNLPGVLERIWCTGMDDDSAEQGAQEQQALTTCLTERQCDERYELTSMLVIAMV